MQRERPTELRQRRRWIRFKVTVTTDFLVGWRVVFANPAQSATWLNGGDGNSNELAPVAFDRELN